MDLQETTLMDLQTAEDESLDEVFTDGAKNGPGFIYLLSEHSKTNGEPTCYYKIGVASKPERRLADLQTGNPRPMYFKGEPTRVTKAISAEKCAQKAVAVYATGIGGGREWFYVGEERWKDFWNCFQKAIEPYVTEREDRICL